LPKNTDPISELEKLSKSTNAIDAFKPDEVTKLGQEAIEEYRIDRESRSEWEQNARQAMKAILQDKSDKNYPWPKASNVRVPLLTTAALQFAARAYPAIVQSPKMVRMEIIGRDTDEKKQKRADRVETHMSYQLMKEIKGWEADTDTLLHQLPAIGCAFRKTFYSNELKRPDARLVPAIDLVVNQSAVSLDTVPRISHRFDLYPHEVQSRIRGGTFADIDLKASDGFSQDEGMRPRNEDQTDSLAAHSFVEQHRYHDLDGDGYAEPWIITIHESSEKVVRIAPNYDLKNATLNKRSELVDLPRYNYFTKYGFIPDPAGGFYDVGFGLLLRTLSDAIDTSLNQMLDAGHLQNAGGGFIGSGLNLKKSELRFSPGVYHTVNAPGNVVRDAVVQLQHAGPSETLMNLLVMLIDFGKQITAVQDILTGESQRAQPATTTLAQIEQGLKVFSAIYKRIYRALGDEYKILYDINGRYPNQEKYLKILDWQPPAMPQAGSMPAMPGAPQGNEALAANPGGNEGLPPGMAPNPEAMPPEGAQMAPQGPMQPPQAMPPIMVQDYSYDDCDIYPVADPHMVTDMQRLAKAQVLMELAGHPTIGPTLNQQEIGKRVLQASNIENIAEIVPPKAGPTPQEQLGLAGMEADVDDKKSSAMLKKAQAQKALAEAGTAGMGETGDNGAQAQTDQAKIQLDAEEKSRRFDLDYADKERQAFESDREYVAGREDAARQHEKDLADQQHKHALERETAEFERSLQATTLGNDAFEADRQAKREDERNQRADLESDRSREDEADRAKSDGELKLNIEKLKAKSKTAAKK
jgi:hypothetical protein